MSTRILCGLWAALTISFSIHAQDQRRFRDEVFPRFDSVVNITYGRAVNLKGEMEELQLDMFSPPAGDTLKKRPVLVFIHGGGFVNGNRKITMGRKICETFARKGFVTVSISYRLGIGGNKTNNDYLDAMYRAQQDGRGAIRYLRSRAAEFGIDTTQVFVTGTSAGAMTSLGLAYMDEHEVPAGVDKNKWGSLEGNSGPAGYSSKVQGVINCWGALPDTAWIDEGDVPLFNT
ncbi:MAG: alpha/beta hydrolase, partial [bacterium]